MLAWPWSRDTLAMTFRRTGGMPPPDWEVLTVAGDGTFRLWRTIARASNPPTPVGRFSGRIPDRRWTDLRQAIDACRRADPVELSLPADAAQEKVVLGKRISSWADDAVPPAPFDELVGPVRALIGELTASPEAAITADLEDNKTATVRHLGSAELELNLATARVRAVRWENAAAADDWQADVAGPRSVFAGPGWAYQMPFEHPFGPDAAVTVQVDDLLAFDGEFWRACSLQSLP